MSAPTGVVSGDPASLRCSVDQEGVPTAQLVWTRLDSGEQLGIGKSYDIAMTTLADNADYVCTPTNSMGDGVPDTARLNVNGESDSSERVTQVPLPMRQSRARDANAL